MVEDLEFKVLEKPALQCRVAQLYINTLIEEYVEFSFVQWKRTFKKAI